MEFKGEFKLATKGVVTVVASIAAVHIANSGTSTKLGVTCVFVLLGISIHTINGL